MSAIKTCRKCGHSYSDKPSCPACRKVASAKYYEKHREAIAARNLVWRAANPEAVQAIQRRTVAKDPAKALAATAAWRLANRQKLSAYGKVYRAANAIQRRAATKAWHQKNPKARSLHEHNRRARAGGGRLSKNLPAKLFALQRGMCPCCRKPLGKDFHLDHIVPLALGGRNEDSNIQLLRSLCNMKKHAKHPVAFMQERGMLL